MSTHSQSLTEGAVFSHLVRLSIPASMGMIFNTLYNLSDFWFAGRLSDDALAGVSIAGSVFFLLLAIGIGVQTGASALVIFLGAEPDIAPLSMEYVHITLFGAFTFILSFAAAGALMAMGNTKSNRNALALGFFLNLVLNPLLTFTLDLGVTGLALATVIIKAASAVYLYYVLYLELGRFSRPRINASKWIALLRQVLPASCNMLVMILGGFITVSLLGRFGSSHVAGYAVGLRLEQVLLLPALGLNSAVMAIAGQNLGAQHHDRVKETYQTGLKVGLVMAAASIPIMLFLSPAMMGFFSADETIKQTGAAYLKIDAVAFYAYVVLFLSTATLQAIKQPVFPMVLGIARQLVIPVSINYWLIVYLDYPMMSVFYTIVSVVVVAAIVAHWYTMRQLMALTRL